MRHVQFSLVSFLFSAFVSFSLFGQCRARIKTTPKALAESMINKPSFVENARGENLYDHFKNWVK